MTDTQLTSALSLVVSLVAVYLLARAFYGYRVDRLRDKIFALRDEMFLYAVEHELLDNMAYENLRTLMNSLLRYAHQLSFERFVLMMLILRVTAKPRSQTYREWSKAVELLPKEQAECISAFHERSTTLIAIHMVSGSPSLIVIGLTAAVFQLFMHPTKQFLSAVRQKLRSLMPVELIEAEALRACQSA